MFKLQSLSRRFFKNVIRKHYGVNMNLVENALALTSPITVITGKHKNDLTREDLLKVIIERKLERITFHYTAGDGRIRELRIPITSRKQAEVILAEGERVDGSSLFKGVVDTGKSDLYVVPVYKTAFLNPFDTSSIDFMCRFFDKEGNPADFASDNILAKASNMLRERTGLELHALGELEFYLIGKHPQTSYPLPKQRGYHNTAPFIKTGEILNDMIRQISHITGNIKYAHYEVGSIQCLESEFEELNGKTAEQVEVEFLPTPIEETGDIMTLASWIVRNVAYRHGFVATFYPKLDIGHAGSGLHFHMALMKDGKNMMSEANGELSESAKALIGGLCQYATSLTAFGNMVAGSYLRLVPNQEAPTKVCWSEQNRSAMIRVPLTWSGVNNLAQRVNPQQTTKLENIPSRSTVEIRTPDGSANAHLLLAGLAMAAEWGLTNKDKSLPLAEASHVCGNIHSCPGSDELPELATSCVESSEILLSNRELFERDGIFPPQVIANTANHLLNENDLNLNKRLLALPEEEKVYESRRIMHRQIHLHK